RRRPHHRLRGPRPAAATGQGAADTASRRRGPVPPPGRMMRSTRLALALALAVAIAGCGSAASATAASTTTTPTTPPLSRNPHITLYSINSDGPRFQAILTGAVGDHLQSLSVYPDDRIDPQHDSDL